MTGETPASRLRRSVSRVTALLLSTGAVACSTATGAAPTQSAEVPTRAEVRRELRSDVSRASVSVSIPRGDIRLSGTLELPEAARPVPAVLMVQGSAAFDRGNRSLFDTLASKLAEAGIASLRVDDRGVGGSGGVKHDLTAEELGDDVAALHAYLASRPETDARKVGILGHSFGAALAPIVAGRSSQVSFIVMLAGYAVTGERLMAQARRRAEESRGAEPSEITRVLAFQTLLFDASRAGGPWEPVERAHHELRRIEFEQMDEAGRSRYADFAAYVARTPDQAVLELARTPWFASFLALDPEPALRALDVPVLAVFGGGDTAVPPELNVEPVRSALVGNPRASVRVVPDANHFFRASGETSAELVSILAHWIEQTVRGS
jgi:uncharacterized protein